MQYHLSGARPLGLVTLDQSCGAALVRRSLISIIRPVEPIEHLVLCGDYNTTVQNFSCTPYLMNKPGLKELIKLISGLVMIERRLPDEVKSVMETDLYKLKKPSLIITELVTSLKMREDEAVSKLNEFFF